MIIPLERRLRKRMHVEIALLQDEVMEILYGVDNGLVLHGGTAIWRCYGGNRFSEDLDFYCSGIGKIEQKFRGVVDGRGLVIKKFKKTANLVFCKISDGNVEIRVEMNYSVKKASVVRSYERTDGSFMDVLTLSPEDLILEKMAAYGERRFIRDIYDVYHLRNYLSKDEVVLGKVLELIGSIQKPVDEKNLKAVVYSGTIPTFDQIIYSLKRRFS
ncbi:MAG: nucleotidyl transferase AbiEii/AbiGii toxin family protein [Candidatus Micrarchaeota archaeon]